MIERAATAAIVGVSGGIGQALADACTAAGFARVVGFGRRAGVRLDLEDEASVAAAASSLDGPPLRLVGVAPGLLHGPGVQPEKTYRSLDPSVLATLFRVNTIGPAMVGKHFLPRVAGEGRAVFAAISARVGSVSDNRLGGWHGYRASKAALNMIVRNFAIEVARARPELVCVTLHPGTVATGLSAPFARASVMTAAESAERLLGVLDGLAPDQSGRCWAYDGTEVLP